MSFVFRDSFDFRIRVKPETGPIRTKRSEKIGKSRETYAGFAGIFGLTIPFRRAILPKIKEPFMKFRSLLIIALSVCVTTGTLFAEKSTEEHIKTLSSGSDSEKYESAVALGKGKEKSAIPELINLLNRNNEPKIATAAAVALGRIAESGDSTIALKNKIISSENGDIVYASLASLLNITTKNEKLEDSTKEAFEFADKNRRGDEYVSDFLDLIKKKLKL